MTEITLKKGTGKPRENDLVEAEFALDVDTGVIYSKLGDGKVTALNTAEYIGVDTNADNYQYWRYKVNGSSTVNVFSMQDVDFQAGSGIEIQQKGYGIEISATAIGGGNPEWDDIQNKPSEFPPSSHTHLVADITDFDPADYQPVGNYATEQYVDDAIADIDLSAGSLWDQNGSDIYYDDGKVGIGEESPRSLLHVNSGTASNIAFFESATNSTNFSISSNLGSVQLRAIDRGSFVVRVGGDGASTGTNATEAMRIDSSGKVGIGTVSPNARAEVRENVADTYSANASSPPNVHLQISNRDTTTANTMSLIGFESRGTTTTTSQWYIGNVGMNNAYADSSFVFGRRTAGSTWSEVMRLDGSGNVIIKPSGKFYLESSSGYSPSLSEASNGLAFVTEQEERMRIDSSGRVGIGGTPSRSAVEIAREAKDTLSRWKSAFDERLKAEPKADKKAVTLEITGDEFSTFPTEEALVERLQRDDIGGGDAKLQVAGGIASRSGKIFRPNQSGITFAGNYWIAVNNTSETSDGEVSLGSATYRFKDAHFSGTIYGKVTDVPDHVKAITPTQIANWDAGTGGGGGATTDGRISDNDIIHWNEAYGWGDHATAGYQPAGSYADANHTHSQYLTSSSLSGYATESWVSSGYQPKGSYAAAIHTHSYVPLSGNSTITGTLTCTGDVIAYSDQRLKDNVETLDGSKVFEMRGVSYTRDGKESSGVIAQEIQKVAPELVHDDGEYLGVAYGNLVGYLIEAVKELKAEVEALKRG